MKIQRTLYNTLSAVLLALCVVSCGKDDGFLPDGTDGNTGELQEFTFTVDVDYTMTGDGGAAAPTVKSPGTRATAIEDDAPTRCFIQVFDALLGEAVGEIQEATGADNYTFTVHLVPKQRYIYCFWADNGRQEITSLESVPYTLGTVAFTASVRGTPESVNEAVTLKHAVAKVTLVTTTATDIANGKRASLTVDCATRYNMLLEAGLDPYTQTFTSYKTGSVSVGEDVLSCYIIPVAAKQDITIGCHLLTQTVTDVPLSANTHVILRGDFSENNKNWKTK